MPSGAADDPCSGRRRLRPHPPPGAANRAVEPATGRVLSQPRRHRRRPAPLQSERVRHRRRRGRLQPGPERGPRRQRPRRSRPAHRSRSLRRDDPAAVEFLSRPAAVEQQPAGQPRGRLPPRRRHQARRVRSAAGDGADPARGTHPPAGVRRFPCRRRQPALKTGSRRSAVATDEKMSSTSDRGNSSIGGDDIRKAAAAYFPRSVRATAAGYLYRTLRESCTAVRFVSCR